MGLKTKLVTFLTIGAISITIVGCQGGQIQSFPSEQTTQISNPNDNSLGEVITQVANNLGINKETVSQLVQKQNVNADDLAVGSVVSKVTKQPLDSVINEEKQTGDWDAVVESHQANVQNVKKELKKRFPRLAKIYFVNHHPGMVAVAVSNYLGIPKQEVIKDWRKYPVRPMGLIHAAILSKLSGKPLTEVLSMRMGKLTWGEVGKQLHVSGEQVKAEWKKLKHEWKAKRNKKGNTQS